MSKLSLQYEKTLEVYHLESGMLPWEADLGASWRADFGCVNSFLWFWLCYLGVCYCFSCWVIDLAADDRAKFSVFRGKRCAKRRKGWVGVRKSEVLSAVSCALFVFMNTLILSLQICSSRWAGLMWDQGRLTFCSEKEEIWPPRGRSFQTSAE